jgi:hypothetical protein
MITIDYDVIRPHMPGGKLLQSQKDGIDEILEAYNQWGDGNVQRCAVVLATARWETAHTMQPVKETTNARDKTPPSDATVIKRLNAAWKAGKLKWVKTPYWNAGWFGRGFVQLTHEANYKGPARTAVLQQFNVDIHKDRDAVMRPDIAAFILVRGMLEGWFTGKKLAEYVDDLDEDDAADLIEYLVSRKVVNGKDRAKEIADLALTFENALRVHNGRVPVPATPIPEEPLPGVPVPKRGFNWWKIGALALAAFAVYYVIFRM